MLRRLLAIVTPTEDHEKHKTKELGEILASIRATDATPKDAPLHLTYRSKFMPTTLIENLTKWEDQGWHGAPHAKHLRTLVSKLRTRCAETTVKTANKPAEWKELNRAKETLQRGIRNGNEEQEHIKIPALPVEAFDLTGIRIAALSQALAYRAIRSSKPHTERERTKTNIRNILRHANKGEEKELTEKDIWRNLRHKDYNRKTADFLWKMTHGAYKCGEYWRNIPGFEHRRICSKCGSEDSMKHILTECKSNGQQII